MVCADRGYDSERHRRALRERGIELVVAKRRTEVVLASIAEVVERTHAWLRHFRRLRIRFERRTDIHGAFLKLGCCLICRNTLQRIHRAGATHRRRRNDRPQSYDRCVSVCVAATSRMAAAGRDTQKRY